MSGKFADHSTVGPVQNETLASSGGDDHVRTTLIPGMPQDKVLFGIVLLSALLFSVLIILLYLLGRRIRRGKLPVDLAFPVGDAPEFTMKGHGGNILLHGRPGQPPSEIPRLLTFIPTDVYMEGTNETLSPVALAADHGPDIIRTSHTTFNGRLNPFSCQFSDFVACEGGEVLSPDSEVSVTIPKGSIPEGKIQQMFVNVSHKPIMISNELDDLHSTPLVEVLAPGLRSLVVPVIVRLPLPPGGAESVTIFWTQSIQLDKISWMTVPRERDDKQVKQLMSYTMDEKFVNVKTYSVESFVCIAMVN